MVMAGAVGGGLGGALGQLGDALSTPRRIAWGGINAMLQPFGLAADEAPATGTEFLANLGMDPESGLTQAVGMGTEILGDPLTWLGIPLGMMAGKATQIPGNMMRNRISGLAATRAGAQEAMVKNALAQEANLAAQTARFDKMRQFVDPESLATGATRSYARPNPTLAEGLEQMGLGVRQADDSLSMGAGLHRNMSHADRLGSPGVPPPFAQPVRGRAAQTLVPREGVPMPPVSAGPTEYERFLLQRQATQAGPEAIRSIHSAADPFAEAAAIRAAETAPSMPMLQGMPADQLFGQTQSQLAQALQQLERMELLRRQLGQAAGIGVAGGVGVSLGDQLANAQ